MKEEEKIPSSRLIKRPPADCAGRGGGCCAARDISAEAKALIQAAAFQEGRRAVEKEALNCACYYAIRGTEEEEEDFSGCPSFFLPLFCFYLAAVLLSPSSLRGGNRGGRDSQAREECVVAYLPQRGV